LIILENYLHNTGITMDTKKTEVENLIAKIKAQQEIIAGQITISSIDIDLQLDYIRNLYEHYIALKQGLVLKKNTEIKPNLSECRTLPLFNNFDSIEMEEQPKMPVEEKENVTVSVVEKEEFEDEKIENLEEFEDEFDEEENFEEELEEEELKELEEGGGEEEDDDDDIAEDEELEEEEDTEDLEDDEESFTSFPEMEIEMNLPTNSDIDIDTIEFEDEDEDEDTDTDTDIENNIVLENSTETTHPITHIGTSGQPRYWGDELGIEPLAARPASIGDKYISNKPSLNEIVSGFKPDESIGMKLQHGSVSDLMKSIDMNLKFLFVGNLFKGNGSLFTEEINKIKSIGKLQEAIKYVETIKDKYNWDDESEAYSELYKLVLKKHAK
jgi:hypothetical protein